MRPSRHIPLLVAVSLAAPALAAAAQSLSLKHQLSIYRDQKEVGFRGPEGIACDDSGAVVVSDTLNGRLVKFTLKGKDLTGGVPVALPELQRPGRAQLDRDGRIVVIDEKTRSILRVDAKGTAATRVAFKGEPDAAKIVPVAFKLDAAGNLYVVDAAARRLLVLDASDSVVRRIEFPKERAMAFTDVAVDPGGAIYAIEAVGANVWAAQKGEAAFKQVSHDLKDYMSFPVFLTLYKGSLLATDRNGMGIVSLGLDGAYRGRQLAMGWTEGLVYYPSQVCVTGTGELFIADRGNNRVQLFTLLR